MRKRTVRLITEKMDGEICVCGRVLDRGYCPECRLKPLLCDCKDEKPYVKTR